MRTKLPALAVLLLAALTPAAGLAQGINSSLGADTSEVGIGPNGTRFDGSMGDPVWLAAHPTMGAAPFSYYPLGYVAPTGPEIVPAPPAPAGVAPGAPPLEYYTPPVR